MPRRPFQEHTSHPTRNTPWPHVPNRLLNHGNLHRRWYAFLSCSTGMSSVRCGSSRHTPLSHDSLGDAREKGPILLCSSPMRYRSRMIPRQMLSRLPMPVEPCRIGARPPLILRQRILLASRTCRHSWQSDPLQGPMQWFVSAGNTRRHSLSHCSSFLLATNHKDLGPMESEKQQRVYSRRITAEGHLIAQPVGSWKREEKRLQFICRGARHVNEEACASVKNCSCWKPLRFIQESCQASSCAFHISENRAGSDPAGSPCTGI